LPRTEGISDMIRYSLNSTLVDGSVAQQFLRALVEVNNDTSFAVIEATFDKPLHERLVQAEDKAPEQVPKRTAVVRLCYNDNPATLVGFVDSDNPVLVSEEAQPGSDSNITVRKHFTVSEAGGEITVKNNTLGNGVNITTTSQRSDRQPPATPSNIGLHLVKDSLTPTPTSTQAQDVILRTSIWSMPPNTLRHQAQVA